MQIEEWREIPGFPRYMVSSFGNVLGLKGFILKPAVDRKGYLRVALHLKNGKSHRRIHHLVLLAFVGPRDTGIITRHLDGNPANNRLENLKYGTHKENKADSVRHGTLMQGTKQWKSKLDGTKVAEILRLQKIGQTNAIIARMFKIDLTVVQKIAQGKAWKHVPR